MSSTTTTTTTTPPPTKVKTIRPTYYTTPKPPTITTTKLPITPKVISNHHFPVSSGADIRFNPAEINISLHPGQAPIIRQKPLSYQQQSFNDGSEKSKRVIVTTHTTNHNNHNQPKPDHIESVKLVNNNHKVEKTTVHSKPQIVNVNYGSSTPEYVYSYEDDNDDYNTKPPQHSYQFERVPTYDASSSETANNFESSKNANLFKSSTYRTIFHPTTKNPQVTTYRNPIYASSSFKPSPQFLYHRSEKPSPQRIQLPLPLLPTLPPLTFSSPAPFSLNRHVETKRFADHPRIVISASASVSDASGRRLNYSLGTIETSEFFNPTSYEDYKEEEIGLEHFYADVPKLQKGRQRRLVKRQSQYVRSSQKRQRRNVKSSNKRQKRSVHLNEKRQKLLVKSSEKRQKQIVKRQKRDVKPGDVIKSEQEVIDILKFLYDWYEQNEKEKTLEATTKITIPVSPQVITDINNELSGSKPPVNGEETSTEDVVGNTIQEQPELAKESTTTNEDKDQNTQHKHSTDDIFNIDVNNHNRQKNWQNTKKYILQELATINTNNNNENDAMSKEPQEDLKRASTYSVENVYSQSVEKPQKTSHGRRGKSFKENTESNSYYTNIDVVSSVEESTSRRSSRRRGRGRKKPSTTTIPTIVESKEPAIQKEYQYERESSYESTKNNKNHRVIVQQEVNPTVRGFFITKEVPQVKSSILPETTTHITKEYNIPKAENTPLLLHNNSSNTTSLPTIQESFKTSISVEENGSVMENIEGTLQANIVNATENIDNLNLAAVTTQTVVNIKVNSTVNTFDYVDDNYESMVSTEKSTVQSTQQFDVNDYVDDNYEPQVYSEASLSTEKVTEKIQQSKEVDVTTTLNYKTDDGKFYDHTEKPTTDVSSNETESHKLDASYETTYNVMKSDDENSTTLKDKGEAKTITDDYNYQTTIVQRRGKKIHSNTNSDEFETKPIVDEYTSRKYDADIGVDSTSNEHTNLDIFMNENNKNNILSTHSIEETTFQNTEKQTKKYIIAIIKDDATTQLPVTTTNKVTELPEIRQNETERNFEDTTKESSNDDKLTEALKALLEEFTTQNHDIEETTHKQTISKNVETSTKNRRKNKHSNRHEDNSNTSGRNNTKRNRGRGRAKYTVPSEYQDEVEYEHKKTTPLFKIDHVNEQKEHTKSTTTSTENNRKSTYTTTESVESTQTTQSTPKLNSATYEDIILSDIRQNIYSNEQEIESNNQQLNLTTNKLTEYDDTTYYTSTTTSKSIIGNDFTLSEVVSTTPVPLKVENLESFVENVEMSTKSIVAGKIQAETTIKMPDINSTTLEYFTTNTMSTKKVIEKQNDDDTNMENTFEGQNATHTITRQRESLKSNEPYNTSTEKIETFDVPAPTGNAELAKESSSVKSTTNQQTLDVFEAPTTIKILAGDSPKDLYNIFSSNDKSEKQEPIFDYDLNASREEKSLNTFEKINSYLENAHKHLDNVYSEPTTPRPRSRSRKKDDRRRQSNHRFNSQRTKQRNEKTTTEHISTMTTIGDIVIPQSTTTAENLILEQQTALNVTSNKQLSTQATTDYNLLLENTQNFATSTTNNIGTEYTTDSSLLHEHDNVELIKSTLSDSDFSTTNLNTESTLLNVDFSSTTNKPITTTILQDIAKENDTTQQNTNVESIQKLSQLISDETNSSISEINKESKTISSISIDDTEEVPLTDAPIYKSANPTVAKGTKPVHSTTPISNRLVKIKLRKEVVNKNYVFNCFDKPLNRYYSDPRDCRLFHYCTVGYTRNQLLDMKFVCDFGTFFDDEKFVCTKVRPARCR